MFKSIILKTFVVVSVFTMLACDKEEELVQPLNTVNKEILVSASDQGAFTLFSFETGTIINNSLLQTTDWDVGLKLITFTVNSGVSGPGNAGVIIQDGVLDNVKNAPTTGYKTDAQGSLAIKDEWYDYNSTTRSFTPKAGKVFIFKTAKGKYAKMEILKGDPTDDNGTVVVPPARPTKIKYTLRYVYQPNGTLVF
ncbi:MAG: HmuY family protein [Saprospiraceae bacterium]|nr:HmuY family protein [Saprospiraceae bacterium]